MHCNVVVCEGCVGLLKCLLGVGVAGIVNRMSLEGVLGVERGMEESKRFRFAMATCVPYDGSGLVILFFWVKGSVR